MVLNNPRINAFLTVSMVTFIEGFFIATGDFFVTNRTLLTFRESIPLTVNGTVVLTFGLLLLAPGPLLRIRFTAVLPPHLAGSVY